MIEVTSRRMECTLLTPDFSQVPAVALHKQLVILKFTSETQVKKIRNELYVHEVFHPVGVITLNLLLV